MIRIASIPLLLAGVMGPYGTAFTGGDPPPPVEKNLTAYLKSKGVSLDLPQACIRVEGWVNMREGLIEVALCTPAGKTHEAALVADCVPSALNAAFIALGYEKGQAVRYTPESYELPEGPPVYVTVTWEDEGGKAREARIEDLILDRELDGPMKRMAWTYTGSQFQPTPVGGHRTYAADSIKSLVTTYHDPTTIVENPLDKGQDDTLYFTNKVLCPPQGTPITITFWKSKPPAHDR